MRKTESMSCNNSGKQLVKTNLLDISSDKCLNFCNMANEALKNKSMLAEKQLLIYFNSLIYSNSYAPILSMGNNRPTSIYHVTQKQMRV